jgi:hypothetical protein
VLQVLALGECLSDSEDRPRSTASLVDVNRWDRIFGPPVEKRKKKKGEVVQYGALHEPYSVA